MNKTIISIQIELIHIFIPYETHLMNCKEIVGKDSFEKAREEGLLFHVW